MMSKRANRPKTLLSTGIQIDNNGHNVIAIISSIDRDMKNVIWEPSKYETLHLEKSKYLT